MLKKTSGTRANSLRQKEIQDETTVLRQRLAQLETQVAELAATELTSGEGQNDTGNQST